MEKDINDRLLNFIKESGLNVNTFSLIIGVNPAVIHNIVKGRRTNPSYEVLKKIGLSFDNIDLNWLITGESKKQLLLEEPKERYSILSVDKKMEQLQKMVSQMANEMKALKKKLD